MNKVLIWENGNKVVRDATPDEVLLEQGFIAEARSTWRNTARLSRAEFCIALKRAGVLSVQEAMAAAKGDWPASFAAALAGVADADEAEILWAGVSTVERMHPLLVVLQAAAGLTDEQLDTLFGWQGAG